MTELWYRAYRTVGGPKAVAQRIAAEVKKRNIGNYLPRICTEPSKSRGEFYFLMGINSENSGELPPAVREFEKWLEFQSIRVVHSGEYVLRDDLTKSWLRREVDIEYTRLLSQWRTQTPDISLDNPFDLSEESYPEDARQMSYNQLLYWLSAYAEGSWQIFRNACAELGLQKLNEPRHLFRRLRLLGHTEYIANSGSWTACPACLVEISGNGSEYRCFLAGTRSLALINKLDKMDITTHANQGAPDALVLSFASYEEAHELVLEINRSMGYDIKLAGRSSKKLTDLLPDISGWKHHFLKSIPLDTGRYELRQWDGQEFARWTDQPKDVGMYRLVDTSVSNNSPTYYLFFDPKENQWLQGDWYGLRYLANWHLGFVATFQYDATEERLVVPSMFRPPEIYERALVLASGQLPYVNRTRLVFKKISSDILDPIVAKLGVHIDGRSENVI